MSQNISIKLKNDIYFSACFTLLFTAYFTQSHIQKTLTVSIQNENKDYTVDGYVCFSIVYISFSLAMWLSPAALVILGRKLTLVLGILIYAPFFSACYFESVFFTYASAATTGIGAALIWTGQANYIVLNSEVGDVYQGISLFWMFYQSSNFFGNTFVYFQFHDSSAPIDKAMRLRIMLILLAFIFLALIMICFLRPPIRHAEDIKIIRNPLSEIKKAFTILISRTCLLLCFMYLYAGAHHTFLSVSGASMGFSKYLSENSKEFAPMSGVTQGIGQFMGAAFALYVAKKQKRTGRLRVILIMAGLANVTAYVFYFLSLPNSSSFGYTDERPIVSLPMILLIVGHVLIGTGDACVHIELYQCLGALYPDDSAPAFSVFKFVRSIASSLSFYYSNFLGLHAQLIVLCASGLIGIISYHHIINDSRKCRGKSTQISTP